MSALHEIIRAWLTDVRLFSKIVVRRELRAYQLAPARAILDSVINRRGHTFVVMMPRQSGKNETQAQIEAYLLNLFQRIPGAQIVKASPTFKPQTINAMMRLERSLANDWNRDQWAKEKGYIVRLGEARCFFFSAEPTANVVGATASILLECDEAQDVLSEKWSKDFGPMRASTNATMVLWGTAWTSRTLLAQVRRECRRLEMQDGVRRVFVVTPDEVIAENPAYGMFLAGEIARQGRDHPLVKTQYFNEEIDAEGGLFPPARQALMRGSHPRQHAPAPGKLYALLIDIAGEDEDAPDPGAGRRLPTGDWRLKTERDATALTIVEVDTTTAADLALRAPTYRVVDRKLWTGAKQPSLFAEVRALALHWNARYVIGDATGIGAGLMSFLDRALPGRVTQFVFTSKTKSDLGWNFIALCDAGRFKDYAEADTPVDSRLFWAQVEACQFEILPGPGKLMRWAVPDDARNFTTGFLIHDDLLISAALCAALDPLPWPSGVGAAIIAAPDPLQDIDREGF